MAADEPRRPNGTGDGGGSPRSGAALPMVSIVIPTYNEAARIEACLESVMAQDYPADRLEVLVVDGRSTDATREKVRAFAARHPQVRLVDNPRRVQPAAVNAGVRSARGDLILRLDAHAWYSPDYIRRCVEVLGETGAATVGGVCETRPGADTLIARSIAVAHTLRFGVGAARFRAGGRAGPVDTVPFGMFRREVFDTVGLLDERLVRAEDNEFNARIRGCGMTVYFDPTIRSRYYARPTLGAFLKQQFGNGFYHPLTLRVNPAGCSLRHLVPLAFVVVLLACGTGGFLWTPLWWAGGAVLGLYLLANLAASLRASWLCGWTYLIVLPWMLLLVHLTYGLATLAGAFRFGAGRLPNRP